MSMLTSLRLDCGISYIVSRRLPRIAMVLSLVDRVARLEQVFLTGACQGGLLPRVAKLEETPRHEDGPVHGRCHTPWCMA